MTPEAAPRPTLTQAWRWLGESVWRLEHAFERSKAANRAADDTRLRIFFILAIFALAFTTLAFEAARSALFSKVGGVGLSTPVAAEARADVLDRQGRLLALDLTHYGLYLDPREVWDTAETRAGILSALPKLSPERLDKALKSNRREYLVGGLTPQERMRVHDLGLPGIAFEDEARRVYPLGKTAAHVIGFADAGGQGLAGVEKAFDKPIHLGAASGQPVQLALDLRVQAALQDEVEKAALAFGAVSGVGIVTKIGTGEVLGMTSWPAFDPNAPGATGVAPLTNHAMASVYELGSVFKVFTIAMGLDRGLVSLDTRFDVDRPLQIGSVSIHDHEKGDHVLTTTEVFTHSSNIGAGKIGLMAGRKVTNDYFHRFGLMEAAPSELLESARPIVPKELSDLTVAQIAFGQGISVSPLALATGMNAVFNHGRYVPLTFRKMNPGERPQGRQVVSEHTSEAMLRLMRLNVTDGSGKKADAPGLRVGGKTGSAQKPEGGRYGKNNISSFVAVFPTDGPPSVERYLVLITLDAPQATKDTFGFITAGWNAAPAAGRVIDRIAPFVGVERVAATPFSASSAASSAPRPE